MRRIAFAVLAITVVSTDVFAVDGQVLINMTTVTAAGGFPYRITNPGSYKLAGNLTVPDGVNGIEIKADNVTLDLNGFRIMGPIVCTLAGSPVSCSEGGSGVGVQAEGNLGVVVKNGSIRGFQVGVRIRETNPFSCQFIFCPSNPGRGTVDGIDASLNSRFGINVSAGSTVRNSTVNRNGGLANEDPLFLGGIVMVCPGLLQNNVAIENVGGNIRTNSGCVLDGNAAP